VHIDAVDQPREPGWYELRLRGRLDPRWSAWLDGMDITSEAAGITVVRGPVVDQSALHGLLARLRDIGLPLISVAQVEPDQAYDTTHPADPDDRMEN
jgi:hypothetical protein